MRQMLQDQDHSKKNGALDDTAVDARAAAAAEAEIHAADPDRAADSNLYARLVARVDAITRTLFAWPDHTSSTRKVGEALFCVGALLAATLVGFAFDAAGLGEVPVVIVYVLSVQLIALFTTWHWYCVLATGVSVVLFNYLFTYPRYTLHAFGSQYPGSFAVMCVVALVSSVLAMQLRRHLRTAEVASRLARDLLETDHALEACTDPHDIVMTCGAHLSSYLARTVVWYAVVPVGPQMPGDGAAAGPVVIPAAMFVQGSRFSSSGAGAGDAGRAGAGIGGAAGASGTDVGPVGAGAAGAARAGATGAAGARAAGPGAIASVAAGSAGASNVAISDVTSLRSSLDAAGVPIERAVAMRAFENRRPAGAGTADFGSASGYYLPLRCGDSVQGVMGVLVGPVALSPGERDVADAVLGECSLVLERNLAQRRREQAELRAKDEQLRANLLRSISHDLRTPLTSIYGNADVLLSCGDTMGAAERTQLLVGIRSDASWLESMVENLLAITKISDGSVQLNKDVELVDDIVEEALRHVSPQVSQHQLSVEPTKDMLLVNVDARLMVQVVVNLVNNAISHTQEGSHIRISSHADRPWVVVSVADDGPGVPEADRGRIFETFYTVGKGLADGRRSVGLGLSLCKSIVEAHGGTIGMTPNVPRGSVFWFRLPAAQLPGGEE
ncbi:MAG: ATP-binding protein [Atopobiaceae bacterium]